MEIDSKLQVPQLWPGRSKKPNRLPAAPAGLARVGADSCAPSSLPFMFPYLGRKCRKEATGVATDRPHQPPRLTAHGGSLQTGHPQQVFPAPAVQDGNSPGGCPNLSRLSHFPAVHEAITGQKHGVWARAWLRATWEGRRPRACTPGSCPLVRMGAPQGSHCGTRLRQEQRPAKRHTWTGPEHGAR